MPFGSCLVHVHLSRCDRRIARCLQDHIWSMKAKISYYLAFYTCCLSPGLESDSRAVEASAFPFTQWRHGEMRGDWPRWESELLMDVGLKLSINRFADWVFPLRWHHRKQSPLRIVSFITASGKVGAQSVFFHFLQMREHSGLNSAPKFMSIQNLQCDLLEKQGSL